MPTIATRPFDVAVGVLEGERSDSGVVLTLV